MYCWEEKKQNWSVVESSGNSTIAIENEEKEYFQVSKMG